MRVYPRAYAALLALFAVVAIHALGQGRGEAFVRAPVSETAAESKRVLVPGRAQPGYLERNFRSHAAPARRDAQGASPDRHALAQAPALSAPESRLLTALPRETATRGPSVAREWHRARAPPLAA
jgi:hypothetical protein